MPVSLKGSTSGEVTLTAPAVAGATTITLPATSGTMAIGGGQVIRSPRYLTTGTSYTTPANCTAILVEAWGGGGGGGGAATSSNVAGGGGSGSYAVRYYTVSPNTAYTYAIGAGGAGGTNTPTAGSAGGSTTFTAGSPSVTLTAAGGGGGALPNPGTGGTGGTATNSDFSFSLPGRNGGLINGNGDGGSSVFWGGEGIGGLKGADPLSPATGYGSGGGGALATGAGGNTAGGAGFQGIIKITEFT